MLGAVLAGMTFSVSGPPQVLAQEASTPIPSEDRPTLHGPPTPAGSCSGSSRHHPIDGPLPQDQAVLDSIQIETSDLRLFEVFFHEVLKAPLVEQRDHPDRDSIRGYCVRGIQVMVRRDLGVVRPTGWVQLNFSVPDVGAVQKELEAAIKSPGLASMSEAEQARIVRLRLKPDVRRGERRAIRLEVSGPEGFMIGFNQYK